MTKCAPKDGVATTPDAKSHETPSSELSAEKPARRTKRSAAIASDDDKPLLKIAKGTEPVAKKRGRPAKTASVDVGEAPALEGAGSAKDGAPKRPRAKRTKAETTEATETIANEAGATKKTGAKKRKGADKQETKVNKADTAEKKDAENEAEATEKKGAKKRNGAGKQKTKVKEAETAEKKDDENETEATEEKGAEPTKQKPKRARKSRAKLGDPDIPYHPSDTEVEQGNWEHKYRAAQKYGPEEAAAIAELEAELAAPSLKRSVAVDELAVEAEESENTAEEEEGSAAEEATHTVPLSEAGAPVLDVPPAVSEAEAPALDVPPAVSEAAAPALDVPSAVSEGGAVRGADARVPEAGQSVLQEPSAQAELPGKANDCQEPVGEPVALGADLEGPSEVPVPAPPASAGKSVVPEAPASLLASLKCRGAASAGEPVVTEAPQPELSRFDKEARDWATAFVEGNNLGNGKAMVVGPGAKRMGKIATTNLAMKEEALRTPVKRAPSADDLMDDASYTDEKAADLRVTECQPPARSDVYETVHVADHFELQEDPFECSQGSQVSQFSDCAGDETFGDRLSFWYDQVAQVDKMSEAETQPASVVEAVDGAAAGAPMDVCAQSASAELGQEGSTKPAGPPCTESQREVFSQPLSAESEYIPAAQPNPPTPLMSQPSQDSAIPAAQPNPPTPPMTPLCQSPGRKSPERKSPVRSHIRQSCDRPLSALGNPGRHEDRVELELKLAESKMEAEKEAAKENVDEKEKILKDSEKMLSWLVNGGHSAGTSARRSLSKVENSASSIAFCRSLIERGRSQSVREEESFDDMGLALKIQEIEQRKAKCMEELEKSDAELAAALERKDREELDLRVELTARDAKLAAELGAADSKGGAGAAGSQEGSQGGVEAPDLKKVAQQLANDPNVLPEDLLAMLNHAKEAISKGEIAGDSVIHSNKFDRGSGRYGIVNSHTARPLYMRFERRFERARKQGKLSDSHLKRFLQDKQNLFQDFADAGGESFDDLMLYEKRKVEYESWEQEEYDLLDRESLLERHHNDVEFVNQHIRSCIQRQNFFAHPDAPHLAHKTLYVCWRSRVFSKAQLRTRG